MNKQAPCADAEIGRAEPSKETTTSKKEGGFQMPLMSSFNSAIQGIKDTLRIDTAKKETRSLDIGIESIDPSKAEAAPKTEQGFHMPKTSLFDSAAEGVMDILEKDAAKNEASSADFDIANVAPSKETTTPKKEGGFQMPIVSSFNSAIQGIKDTLRINTAKKETTSLDRGIESIDPSKAEAAPKKEQGFHMPKTSSVDSTVEGVIDILEKDAANNEASSADSDIVNVETSKKTTTLKKGQEFQMPRIPSFDSTIERIKETLGIDAMKKKAVSADTSIGTAAPPKATITPKKEGGFQMPSTPSFDKTMQEIKEIFKIDTTKKELPSADTGIESVAPSKETTTPKKEEEFHMPTIPSFDSTIERIKETFRIDAVQKEAPSVDLGIASTEPPKETFRPKKEGGFQMPNLLSFDKTMQEIKEIFRIDATKKEQSSADTGIESVEQSKETNPPKKEGGFQLPTIPSLESTIQGIKETLRIDTAKKELSSVDRAIESVEQSKDMSTPKKEGGSQLPTIPLFDNAIQGIKETLRIGSAKNEALLVDTGIESGEPSQEMTSPKKEGEFQMPSTPSFDKTMQEIKEIFKIDTTKKELPSADTGVESVAP
ncbi:unnamed protein product, partial [Rotaria sp. Silwood1]